MLVFLEEVFVFLGVFPEQQSNLFVIFLNVHKTDELNGVSIASEWKLIGILHVC